MGGSSLKKSQIQKEHHDYFSNFELKMIEEKNQKITEDK